MFLVAEERLQFEHRDLHWGNVLVREESGRPQGGAAATTLRYQVSGRDFAVKADKVRVTIIDFSLSR